MARLSSRDPWKSLFINVSVFLISLYVGGILKKLSATGVSYYRLFSPGGGIPWVVHSRGTKTCGIAIRARLFKYPPLVVPIAMIAMLINQMKFPTNIFSSCSLPVDFLQVSDRNGCRTVDLS